MEFRPSKHIAINVKDYEQAVSFYRDVLGWELVKYTERESQFKKGDANYFIADDPTRAYAVFFEYEVDDIDAAKAFLESSGCTVREVYGPHSIMFTDPHGTNFHIYQKGTPLPEL